MLSKRKRKRKYNIKSKVNIICVYNTSYDIYQKILQKKL